MLVREAVVFNAAGFGSVPADGSAIGAMVAEWQTKLAAAGLADIGSSENLYTGAAYQQARAALAAQYSLGGTISSPGAVDPELSAKLVHVFGHATHDDSEHVANSGRHGVSYPVFIEDQPDIEGLLGRAPIFEFVTRNFDVDFGNTHSLTLLMDALALMGLLQTVDPGLTVDGGGNFTLAKLNAILASASNQRASGFIGSAGIVEGDPLERALDALRKIFTPTEYGRDGATPFERDGSLKNLAFANMGNRSRFYQGLNEVTQAITALQQAGKTFQISPLIDTTYPATTNGEASGATLPANPIDIRMAASGADGVAYRYALRELNPIVIVGPDYKLDGSDDPALKLYDPQSAPEGMTAAYIEERWQMLRRKLDIGVRNENNDVSKPVNQQSTELTWASDTAYYGDLASGFAINQNNQRNTESRIIFGTSNSDALLGGSKADKLFASAGDDILTGAKGDDYLEGGVGFDTFRFAAGDGNDTILDADGRGLLIRDGKPIAIGIKLDDTQWQLGSTTFTVTQNGKDLVISYVGSTDKVTLKDFDFTKARATGYDGIRLIDAPVAPNPTAVFTGDLKTDKNDNFAGTALGEKFLGKTGNDFVDAGGGDDLAYGDEDRDRVVAGAGNDWVEGGAGGDVLSGGADVDVLWADSSSGTLAQAITIGETASSV
ncbi:MAG: calcium-binding protein, partial [Betaproteobacteria bacterium]